MMATPSPSSQRNVSQELATKKELERNSDIKNEFIVKIVKETVNTITLAWNSITEADVYRVEKYHRRREWEKVEWTGKSLITIGNLDENFGYRMRVKALKLTEHNGMAKYEIVKISNEIVGCTQASEPTAIGLYRAIKKDQQYLVKRILRRRPTLIEYPGPNGYSPLANAIAHCDMNVVDILLSAGANVHEGNSNINRTPLHQAFYYGRLSVARMLLNKKANMEAQDMYGLTPCHLAVDANQGEILKFALENGANVEARDACGWTLLMRAVVLNSNLSILQILTESGADMTSRDFRNLTCQDLARLYGNKMAQEFFENLLKTTEVENSQNEKDK